MLFSFIPLPKYWADSEKRKIGLSQTGTWIHLSWLIARMIGLSKQLRPYWDWRDYYQRDCLVANTRRYPQEPRQPSCTVNEHFQLINFNNYCYNWSHCIPKLCEDISAVDVVANVSSRFIMDHYLNQELPVIVSDGALNWAVFKNSDFGLEHILKVVFNFEWIMLTI